MTCCREGLNLPLISSCHPPHPSSFFLFCSLSFSLLFIYSSLSSPVFTVLSQEGCEVVLCRIKETGAVQSKNYDIRIVCVDLWISENQIFCDSAGIALSSSSSQFFSDIFNKSLCARSFPQLESVFILFQFVIPLFTASSLLFGFDTSKKNSTADRNVTSVSSVNMYCIVELCYGSCWRTRVFELEFSGCWGQNLWPANLKPHVCIVPMDVQETVTLLLWYFITCWCYSVMDIYGSENQSSTYCSYLALRVTLISTLTTSMSFVLLQ